MNLLTLNAGSSSIKFGIFESLASPTLVVSGHIERIGLADAFFTIENHSQPNLAIAPFSNIVKIPTYTSAIHLLINWMLKKNEQLKIGAIGYRIVHGGEEGNASKFLTAAILEKLQRLNALDPEHLPQEMLLIHIFQQYFPDLQQILCFDTAFHHELPRVAKILPIPRRYEDKGLRRYGFHGLSYTYLLQALPGLIPKHLANGRVVLAHLGNGSSLTAVSKGRSIDTTMGFSPCSGILMSTRSGDLDPNLTDFLMHSESLNLKQFNHLVNFESGLLGISETSSDMRDLLNIQNTDYRAAEAVSLFCYQVKKQIGAYAAVLEGIDVIVFSGGIGENSSEIRARVCDGLGFLGVHLNVTENLQDSLMISSATSRVKVLVIPTNEEKIMAMMMWEMLNLPEK